MHLTFFLDRKSKPETAKAQVFYLIVSLFEGMVISFLTIFLNQCRKELLWTDTMSSLSLFLPPFVAALSIFLCSFLVSHQKRNLFLMRILLLASFVLILVFSLTGLFLDGGISADGVIADRGRYHLLFVLFLVFSSLLMGIHWSFLSFHSSCIADINYAEKTRYGHVCLYGVLSGAIASPIAGYLAECLYVGYRGYLFLFLLATPILVLLFVFTYLFRPFPGSLFHFDEDERVKTKLLFQNRNYIFYLFLASLWIPLIWASNSLTSDLWTGYESTTSTLNSFNSLTWGFYLSVSYFFEFVIIFLNTHFGIGKKVSFSLTLALLMIFIETLSLGVLSYFYTGENEASLPLAIAIILLHSFKGMSNGLYLTSNIAILTHILGPKKRRKAVFIAPCIFQLVNSVLQLSYPYLNSMLYTAFFIMAGISLFGFLSSIYFDRKHLNFPSKDQNRKQKE